MIAAKILQADQRAAFNRANPTAGSAKPNTTPKTFGIHRSMNG